MAFVKFITSLVIGGGLGYGLLLIATPDESELVKNLPPHSSQKQNLFRRYKQQPEEFMNSTRPKASFQEHKTQESANVEK